MAGIVSPLFILRTARHWITITKHWKNDAKKSVSQLDVISGRTMLLTGRINKIDKSPYEAFLSLREINFDKIWSLTLNAHEEDISIQLPDNGTIEVEVFVWHAQLEVLPSVSRVFIEQQPDKNGTFGCAEIIRAIDTDRFECRINDSNIIIYTEEDYDISVGNFVRFEGELHAEI